ncbi:RQC domain protein [Candidatus Dependentiae bacterium]|nr:RQC domain protein [Candidatus Dependentiae bacterium]
MTGKVRKINYTLNSGNIKKLEMKEIEVIIHAADHIVYSGGRNILTKILKGSRGKKILDNHFEEVPGYGYFKEISLEEITNKIDWCIINNYLKIEYDRRLPLIILSEKGWEIARRLMIDKLMKQIDGLENSPGNYYDMTFLKDRSRQMILELLDKIKESENPKYIPLLKSWYKIDYKKVRKKIREVINYLEK